MADTDGKVYGGRWRVVRTLGKGGQGIVYEVEDTSVVAPEELSPEKFKNALRNATAMVYHQGAEQAMLDLMEMVRRLSATTVLPKAALKETPSN